MRMCWSGRLASGRLLIFLLGSLLATEAMAAKLYRFQVDGRTEELVVRRTKEAAEQQRQEKMAQQKEADINLLRLYEQPSDVERARLRKAEEVGTYISLQERRQEALEQKLAQAQRQAEGFTSRGVEVPGDIQQELNEVSGVLADSKRDIRDRRTELGRITREYAEQYERVRILQVYPPGTLYDEVDFERVDRFSKAKPPVSR